MPRIPLAVAVGLPLSALLMATAASSAAADRNAMIACQLAQSAQVSGPQDPAAMRTLVEQVSSAAAQSTEPEVRRRATMLARSTRQANPTVMDSALRSFRETCQRTVGATSAKKADEVPEAEFDRQLHDVLERTGRPNASCDKQRFGDGWVAVCQ